MIYIVPNANCVCLNNGARLFKGVKFQQSEVENLAMVFVAENCFPLTLNLYEICNNFVNGRANKTWHSGLVQKNVCVFGGNVFVFLNFVPICNFAIHTFKFKNREVAISLGKSITISVEGETLVEMPNFNLTYSKFETFNEFCFIYFLGERNFVAILKGQQLFYANYYDKLELLPNEYYFLTYLKDSLNHGKVCYVGANKSEIYLVYLDENELRLKNEFLPCVFLDCLKAENFKYCNALLSSELRQNDPCQIANFFCEFDCFYPLENLTFALIKKDAVAGIYTFEIENGKICNICEI